MMLNEKTMTIKLPRGEVCDILMALTAVDIHANRNQPTKKWAALHDKVKEMLDAFDEKNGF